jgi:hypothetical protein
MPVVERPIELKLLSTRFLAAQNKTKSRTQAYASI